MQNLFNSEKYADIIFTTEGEKLYVNKCALSEESEFLAPNVTEYQVEIPYQQLHEIIAYGHDIPIDFSVFNYPNPEPLLVFCSKVQVPGFLKEIVDYLISNEIIDTYSDTTLKILAKGIKSIKLLVRILQYISSEKFALMIEEEPLLLNLKSEKNGSNILHNCVRNDEIATYLIDNHKFLIEKDNNGMSPFMYACLHGSLHIVKRFIQESDSYLLERTTENYSPLLLGACNTFDVFYYIFKNCPQQMNFKKYARFIGERINDVDIFNFIVAIKPSFLKKYRFVKTILTKNVDKEFVTVVRLIVKKPKKIKRSRNMTADVSGDVSRDVSCDVSCDVSGDVLDKEVIKKMFQDLALLRT